jgi:hypothetical protein
MVERLPFFSLGVLQSGSKSSENSVFGIFNLQGTQAPVAQIKPGRGMQRLHRDGIPFVDSGINQIIKIFAA